MLYIAAVPVKVTSNRILLIVKKDKVRTSFYVQGAAKKNLVCEKKYKNFIKGRTI